MRALTEWIPVDAEDLWRATMDDKSVTAPVRDRICADFGMEVAYPSARAALVGAFVDAGLGSDDEVILPAYACYALVEAVEAVATPIFVDVDPCSFTLDLNALERTADEAKAVVPVHPYGETVDMAQVREIANRHELVVVEDAAQALGAALINQNVGSYADYCVFSFRFSKEVTTYKGGILLGDTIKTGGQSDPDRAAPLRLGATKAANVMLGCLPGRMYEPLRHRVLNPLFTSSAESIGPTAPRPLTPGQRRLLDIQLNALADRVAQRREHAKRYATRLGGSVKTPSESAHHTYFRYPVLVSPEARKSICRDLRREGIGVSTMWDYTVAPDGEAKNAERVATRVVNLPVHAGLNLDTVDRISTVFNRIVREHK